MWELIYTFHGDIETDIKTHFRLIRYENEISGDDIMNNFCKWYQEGEFCTRDKCFDIGNTVFS